MLKCFVLRKYVVYSALSTPDDIFDGLIYFTTSATLGVSNSRVLHDVFQILSCDYNLILDSTYETFRLWTEIPLRQQRYRRLFINLKLFSRLA